MKQTKIVIEFPINSWRIVRVLALVVFSLSCARQRPPMVHLIPPTIGNEGLASWYGIEESGRTTASGEIMDPENLTAAHRTLDFGTLVRVTNLKSRQSVDVIINDRGPFVRGRLIDLSFAAAREINMVNDGVVQVRLKVLGLSGPLSERRWRIQVASFRNSLKHFYQGNSIL